jgi:hypothetical protein
MAGREKIAARILTPAPQFFQLVRLLICGVN